MTQQMTLELPNKAYILPPPIPAWPPVWWFWLVLAVLVTVAVLACVAWFVRYRRRAYRREAIAMIQSANSSQQSDQALIQVTLEAIRRCLLTAGDDTLASTPTKALLPLLDQRIKRPKYRLQDLDDLYTQRLYQAHGELSSLERDQLIRTTCYWIRKHNA